MLGRLVVGLFIAFPVAAQQIDSTHATFDANVVSDGMSAARQPYRSAGSRLRTELGALRTPAFIVFNATASQVWQQPMSWDRTVGGFGRRVGFSAAGTGTRLAVTFGTAQLLGQDPAYRRQGQGSVFSRVRHAALGQFTAYAPTGRKQFAPGTVLSVAAVGVVERQLLPDDVSTRMIIGRAASGLLFRSLLTIGAEFVGRPPNSKVSTR